MSRPRGRPSRGCVALTMPHLTAAAATLLLLLPLLLRSVTAQESESAVQSFRVLEGSPPSTFVGKIGGDDLPLPPFLVVPLDASADADLSVDPSTGEVRTRRILDRERTREYRLSAVGADAASPSASASVTVVVEVQDVNDHTPEFDSASSSSGPVRVAIPENSPRGSRRKLPSASDGDGGLEGVSYDIVSGNDDNAFGLDQNGGGLELVVLGDLDRERAEHHDLRIVASDGDASDGATTPSATSTLSVRVDVQDLNDNAPVFRKQRYFATLPSDAPPGREVLAVGADDADAGDNGRVGYAINGRQSSRGAGDHFAVDERSGVIRLDRRLPPESGSERRVFEIVVVARDGGEVAQESSAFVTVRITTPSDVDVTQQSTTSTHRDATGPKLETARMRLEYPSGRDAVPENAQVGLAFAQVVVEPKSSPLDLEIDGGVGSEFFSMIRNASGFYLAVKGGLDYEIAPTLPVVIAARDPVNPTGSSTQTFSIAVEDANEFAPVFERKHYEATLDESSEPRTLVTTVRASDADGGPMAGRVSYSLIYDYEDGDGGFSDWFAIDEETGEIRTQTRLECEDAAAAAANVLVLARDGGAPPLSATATVSVSVVDANDNPPVFVGGYYWAELSEEAAVGECFLEVKATDADCGANAEVSYTIEGGSDAFEVDQESGQICLRVLLDRETQDLYSFSVTATDKGGLSSTAMVEVSVSDVNDNAPEFLPSDYVAKVRSRFPSGPGAPSLLTVKATDPDEGEGGEVSYQIEGGDGIFAIDERTGDVRLERPLPESAGQSRDTFRFRVYATDGLGVRSAVPASVEVRVDDDDLTFEMPQYRFSAPEDASPYSEVGNVLGGNLNLGLSRRRRLTVFDTNAEGLLSVDPLTGALRTEARLDHETRPQIILNLMLEDTDTGKESNCQAILEVQDVNDNAPEFPGGASVAKVAVREDARTGTVAYAAAATDPDSGANGRVSFSLLDGGDFFRVDPRTGDVVLSRRLDRESRDEHVVRVQAADAGRPVLTSTLEIHVSVTDANDHAPEFERASYAVDVPDDLSAGAPLATLTATDADSGLNGKVSYALDPPNPYVAVLRNTGVLILKKPLDAGFATATSFRVVATDRGEPPMESSAQVALSLSNRNSNAPAFDRYRYVFSVKEDVDRGTVVGTVKATDADGDRVIYSLAKDGNGGLFSVDAETGQIKVEGSLDRETEPEHKFVVEASDGTRGSTVVVTVDLEDVNDVTPRLSPSDGVVFVSNEVGLSRDIARLRAEDNDRGNAGYVTFKLKEPSSIVRVTANGNVKLLRPLSSQTSFVVVMTDEGNPPLSSEATISLVKSGNADVGANATKSFQVDPSSPIGTKVGSVGTGSSDYHYKIGSSPRDLPFVVDAMSGDVYTSADLSHHDQASLEFDVRLTSVGGESGPRTISVKADIVSPSGDVSGSGPEFNSDPITLAVKESEAIGTVVANLKQFSTGIDEFKILEQQPSKVFKISKDGSLALRSSLDYEMKQEHLLVIRGFSRKGRLSADVTVLVNVTDVNDNAPKILLSSRQMEFPSSSPVAPSPLISFVVLDADAGEAGRVALHVRRGNEDGTFAVDPDSFQLSLSRPPTRSEYRLLLRATDFGSPQLFVEEDVTIKFEQTTGSKALSQSVYRATAMENSPPGSAVLTVGLAEGVSSHDKVFQLLKGNDLFKINERTGEIETIAILDREEEGDHSLVVGLAVVGDESRATDTAVVYVTVDDTNDNAPKFARQTCRDLTVMENSGSSYLHAFVADDPDLGENGRVSYSLSSPADDEAIAGLFRIERDTGKLHAEPLDREKRELYDLEVLAIDHGPERLTTRCSVKLRVLDENDNDPSFTQSIYSASVREDIPEGTEVVKVTATDLDQGENAKVRYSLENATDWAFAINERTGSVFTIRALDRESVSEVRFDVLATDGGRASVRSSRTAVKIIVTDANDHVPEFDAFPFPVNMTATPAAGVPLLRVSARDPDVGPNGHLTYNIVRPEQRERFHLSPEEGLLTVASADVEWEPGTIERIEVAVSDAGSPPKSSTGLIEILIEGGPPVALKFQQAVYQATIPENPLSGRDIMQVRAVRSDGRRQRVIYSFLRGNELGAFEINSNNGLIRVRDPALIDYETKQQFNMTISARGLGDDSLLAYASCQIRLQDVNDHAPKFTREIYNVKVLEGNRKGAKVVQTKAVDKDVSQSDSIRYEIIDGNVDGVFAMDEAVPGTIVANTVLDREIRDNYELTLSATDAGSPPLVGLAQVIIKVVDVNDNQPHFSPIGQPVRVPRTARPGSAVATFRANDVDLAPAVSYRLKYPNDHLTVDVSTGRLLVLKTPQRSLNAAKLTVVASDGRHETEQDVEVAFGPDPRQCRRVLSKPLFNLLVSFEEEYPMAAGNIDVTPCDGATDGVEFEVSRRDQALFSVLPNGTVVVNREFEGTRASFVVTAVDGKTKSRNSAVVTVTKTSSSVKTMKIVGGDETLDVSQAKAGVPLAILRTNQDSSSGLFYSISPNTVLDIESASGALYLKDGYNNGRSFPSEVTVTVKRLYDMQSASKVLKISGLAPGGFAEPEGFKESEVQVTLFENAPLGTAVRICDFASGNRHPVIAATSGNRDNTFSFDAQNLRLTLAKSLSHKRRRRHHVVMKMTTSDQAFSLCSVVVNVLEVPDEDESDGGVSVFPLSRFVTSVAENSPPGTRIDGPPIVNKRSDPHSFWISALGTNLFNVDLLSGQVTTSATFDYEDVLKYESFFLYANSSSGLVSECFVKVLIESRDEFPPTFEYVPYYFTPISLEVGAEVGSVSVTDRDEGPDGFVDVALSGAASDYFALDRHTGAIVIAKRLDTGVFDGNNDVRRRKRSLRDVNLVVTARSRQPDSLQSTALVTIALETSELPAAARAGLVPGWLQGVLICVILLLIALVIGGVFVCKKRRQREEEARKNSMMGIANPALSMEMAASGDGLSRFPPQYSEIVSDYSKGGKPLNARSEMSEKSHRSASSGRGSVEDGEEEVDVEIRMINEGNYYNAADSSAGFAAEDEPDRASEDGSVQNTEEYLARLGIDVRKPPNIASTADVASSNGGGYENAYGSSIYNRIPDDALSERNSVLSGSKARGAVGGGGGGSLLYGSHSHPHHPPSVAGSLASGGAGQTEDDLVGSYNWDYLLDWGPQYQPLAHVFKEISKLKDDSTGGPQSGGGLSVSAVSNSSTLPVSSPLSPTRKFHGASHVFRAVGGRPSPISHENLSGGGGSGGISGPLSPSFHPALSPLATKSPSVSPLAVPVAGHARTPGGVAALGKRL